MQMKQIMRSKTQVVHPLSIITICIASSVLTACGGSDSQETKPNSPITPSEKESFSIKGTITGLTKNGLILSDGMSKEITVKANSSLFSFGEAYTLQGQKYDINIIKQPATQTCQIENGKGTVTKNVANISVICKDQELQAAIIGDKKFAWQISQPLNINVFDADNKPAKIKSCVPEDINSLSLSDDCTEIKIKRLGTHKININTEKYGEVVVNVEGVPVRQPMNITNGNESVARVITPDGKVAIWGGGDMYETYSTSLHMGVKGSPNRNILITPEYVLNNENGTHFSNAYQVTSGHKATYILNEKGSIYGMGGYQIGKLPYDSDANTVYPSNINEAPGTDYTKGYVSIAQGSDGAGLALKDDGTVYMFNYEYTGYPQPIKMKDGSLLRNIMHIAGQGRYFYAINNEGKTYKWYRGSGRDENIPKLIKKKDGSELSHIIKISAGAFHTLALDSRGQIWSWGSNTWNQLGNKDYLITSAIEYAIPVTMPVGTTAIDVAAGFNSSYAVTAKGNSLAWGESFGSKLGMGNIYQPEYYKLPTYTVSETGKGQLSDVKAITALSSGAFVLKNDGTMWGWGGNTERYILTRPHSELISSSVPVPLKGVDAKGILTLAPLLAYPAIN